MISLDTIPADSPQPTQWLYNELNSVVLWYPDGKAMLMFHAGDGMPLGNSTQVTRLNVGGTGWQPLDPDDDIQTLDEVLDDAGFSPMEHLVPVIPAVHGEIGMHLIESSVPPGCPIVEVRCFTAYPSNHHFRRETSFIPPDMVDVWAAAQTSSSEREWTAIPDGMVRRWTSGGGEPGDVIYSVRALIVEP